MPPTLEQTFVRNMRTSLRTLAKLEVLIASSPKVPYNPDNMDEVREARNEGFTLGRLSSTDECKNNPYPVGSKRFNAFQSGFTNGYFS